MVTYNFRIFCSLYFGFPAHSLVWRMSVITWSIYIPSLKSVFYSVSLCSLESIWVLLMGFQEKVHVTVYLVQRSPGSSLRIGTGVKCSLDTYLASSHKQWRVFLGACHGLCTTLCDVGSAEVEIRTTSVWNMTLCPAPGIGSGTYETKEY